MKKLEQQLTRMCLMLTIMVLGFFASLMMVSFLSRRNTMLSLKEDFSVSRSKNRNAWDLRKKTVAFRAGSGGGGISGGYALGSYTLEAEPKEDQPPRFPPADKDTIPESIPPAAITHCPAGTVLVPNV